MPRFAHMADLHLDSPFSGLDRPAPGVEAALADASLQAWDRAVAICLEQRVDFVLIAGDVYEQEEAGVRAQMRFLRGLQRLAAEGVATFVVHGNHDPRGGRWSAIRSWPPGVTVFGSDEVSVVPAVRGGEVVACVHGLSYPERHVTDNLARRFHRTHDSVLQVGLLHAHVGEQPGHGRYAPCSLEDLRRAGLDYWALGHVHTRQVLSPAAPAVVYPGNLQARHPGETGPRGLYIVDAEPGAPPHLDFHAADVWRFAAVELDLAADPADSLESVIARLARTADRVREDRGLIATAEVTGPTALHGDLMRPGARDDLLRQLRDDAGPHLWWDEFRVRTRPLGDRAQRMQAGDFLADLMRGSARRRPAAASAVEAAIAELRDRGALHARQHVAWADLVSDADALWSEAEALAEERLERQAGPE